MSMEKKNKKSDILSKIGMISSYILTTTNCFVSPFIYKFADPEFSNTFMRKPILSTLIISGSGIFVALIGILLANKRIWQAYTFLNIVIFIVNCYFLKKLN